MVSTRFAVLGVGRDANKAFIALREEALYLYGHGRKTDTIGDKTDFLRAGVLSSQHLDYIPKYWLRTVLWHQATHKNKAKLPPGVPDSIAPLFAAVVAEYLDPQGPAICFEITGKRVPEIKESLGKARMWGRVFWFGGTV